MVQAIVDPEELRSFASRLAAFSETLRDQLAGLDAEFGRLQETWRDQEQERFEEVYHEAKQSLAHFLEAADVHVSFLSAKAEDAQQYLDRRI